MARRDQRRTNFVLGGISLYLFAAAHGDRLQEDSHGVWRWACRDVDGMKARKTRSRRRIVKRLLFAALGVGLLTSQATAQQSARESIQGVWRIVDATISGPGARTIAFADRPNLTIITARHYSRV